MSLTNCSAVNNGRRALGWGLLELPFVFTNSLDVNSYRESDIPAAALSTFNSWDEVTGVTATNADFLSLDDSGMFGPRSSDGSLPVTDFASLAPGSDLVDSGTEIEGGWFSGAAPDLGCFESG